MDPSSPQNLLPVGQCYAWTPGLLWLNTIADLLIGLALLTGAFVLWRLARSRTDAPTKSLFTCLAALLGACGAAHLIDVWNVWHADHWLSAIVTTLAALVAIPAAWWLSRAAPALISTASAQDMQRANAALERANRELESFTASVSHDLRSPLSSIAGQAGLLEISLGDQATEDQKRRMQRIQGSVKQMSELIESLLVLSRISRHALQTEDVDVTAAAEQAVAELRQQEPQRDVAVTIQPGMRARVDRRLFATALFNLVSNAWKFTGKTAAASIEIGMTREGDQATLYVRDNGAGFDMAYEDKLFKPFQRLHGASDFPGNGIGLASVQRIVERHGGRVWARGKLQEGAVFYCTLPPSTH